MKYLLLAVGIIGLTLKSYSQDIINPYENYSQLPNLVVLELSHSGQYYDFEFTPLSYNGEYQVELGKFIWGLTTDFSVYSKSIEIETVSFPFTPHDECAFSPNGCVSTNPERILMMPISPYDPATKSWGEMDQFAPLPTEYKNTLSSNGFVRASALGNLQALLPHTILKHTINLRCGFTDTDPIVASISFIYDNTRGRMRYYPFKSTNSAPAGPINYDVVFRPQLVHYRPTASYNQPFNNVADHLWGSSLNYFPFSEIPNPSPCQLQGFSSPNALQTFYDESLVLPGTPFTNYQYSSIWIAPYSLLNSFARSFKGEVMAGYDENTGQPLPGIKHDYFIDRNIELTVLNQNERKLYNPSEVSITTSNLIFPSWYSFQTVRGVYPTVNQVTIDNTIENGGPYPDPREVPVRTDLRSEDPTYPHDASILEDSRYASLYKLQSGSKITIEPCVKIFDAAFILNSGSTLKYENYNTQIGYYPDNLSISRVAIDRNGGRLIRQYDNTLPNATLYLQYQTEVSNAPNSYIVDGKIMAGSNVDPLQTAGPYIASSGTALELIAKNYVKLENGFQAHAGSEVKIAVDPTMNIPICPPIPPAPSNNSRIYNSQSNELNSTASKAVITPNPVQQFATVSLLQSGSSNIIQRIQLHDAKGQLLFTKDNINNASEQLDAQNLTDGLYFLTVTTNSNTETLKFIVSKNY
jgi:hypothetical protein